MGAFDIKHFIGLAKEARATEYYKKADWSVDGINNLIAEESDPEYLEEYTEEDILCMTEDIAFAIPTDPLPEEVARLVQYGYSLAFDRQDRVRINNFGTLFYNGRIGFQDFGKAAEYYKMASDLGFSLATENLGYIYYYGRTGEVNYEMAYQLFSKASAVFNRACSTYKLGDMFKNGHYVTMDLNSAFECYKRAESLIGNGPAENSADRVAADIYFRLGECYFYGKGTETDYDKALEYFQKAERGFIVKVRNGEFMLKKMLVKSIERQDDVREKLIAGLPGMEWARKNRGYLNI